MTEVKSIAKAVANYLADTYTLYLKTQNYHWNVTGPNFHSLHAMFEQEYIELASAVDLLAEHIRALGEKSPGSFKEFSEMTSIKEAQANADSTTMVKQLQADHVAMAKKAHDICKQFESSIQESTQDLFTSREAAHQKAAWMLKATMGE